MKGAEGDPKAQMYKQGICSGLAYQKDERARHVLHDRPGMLRRGARADKVIEYSMICRSHRRPIAHPDHFVIFRIHGFDVDHTATVPGGHVDGKANLSEVNQEHSRFLRLWRGHTYEGHHR